MSDERDIIIEGYHIETSMIKRLETRFSEIIRSYILVKTDKEKLVSDFMKSTSLNDWIIKRTVYPETFGKIADMISLYSEEISTESHECEIQTLDMSSDFDEKIEDIIIKNS